MNKIFGLIFMVLSVKGYCQFDNLGINTAWNKGSIHLTTGEKLAGFIQNNEQLHLIRYKPSLNNDEGSRLVKEQDIMMLEYFDDQTGSSRRFAFINYKASNLPESLTGKKKSLDLQNGSIEGAALFEILMEYKQFAALCRVSKVDVAKRKRNANLLSAIDTKNDWEITKEVGFEYFEEFYFFSDEGKLSPVLILNYLERDKENFITKRDYKDYKPDLNREVVKRYMEDHWYDVEEYLDKNDLSMKEKNNFLSLLKYYKELESR